MWPYPVCGIRLAVATAPAFWLLLVVAFGAAGAFVAPPEQVLVSHVNPE
ncbi:MAG: hypothetical protein ACYDBZ_10970 [Steroidobacteraceae bacterium]